MRRVLLLQFDGKMPNLALMRIAAHHSADEVELRQVRTPNAVQPDLFGEPDLVYGSLIFERSRSLATHTLTVFPNAHMGGTGWSYTNNLWDVGVMNTEADYSIYPDYPHSIGFTQRGCRFRCPFCVVPGKEGKNWPVATIADIWRGDPYPREIVLLDNDFLGQPDWRDRVDELRDGGFRVNFNQGVNVRTLTDEAAAALASLQYYDHKFRARRLHTAWDNRKDEARVIRGLEALIRYGVKPDHLMVLMLIGYWPGETVKDWDYRRRRLRAIGARPYPMPYVRNPITRGFQRWVVGAYDKRIPWDDWALAGYEPRNLGMAA